MCHHLTPEEREALLERDPGGQETESGPLEDPGEPTGSESAEQPEPDREIVPTPSD